MLPAEINHFPSININHLQLLEAPAPKDVAQSTQRHPAVTSVCRNWADHLSKRNNISLDEAYERIFSIIHKNTPDKNKITQLVQALEQRNWVNPLFSSLDEFPYYAMEALNEGMITLEQFTTLMFYRMAVQYHKNAKEIRSIALFVIDPLTKAPKPNPVARDLIQRTLRPVQTILDPLYPESELLDETKPHLTDAQVDQFFEKMASKPLSEQQFFIAPDIQDESSQEISEIVQDLLDRKRTISQDIKETVGINVFNRFLLHSPGKPDKKMRMIPSLSMMQIFLDVKFENPVKINPVICLSPIEAIWQNARERTRELAITFTNIKLPITADHLYAPAYDFPYHDFYHAIIASAVPQKHIEGFLILVEILEQMSEDRQFENIKHIIKEFADRILDMEKSYYRQDSKFTQKNPGPQDAVFWASVSSDLVSTQNRLALAKSQTKEALKEAFKENATALASTVFFEHFLIEIIKRIKDFSSKEISIAHFTYAAVEEEINLRKHLQTSPGLSTFAFNQEDHFENFKLYSMFLRWEDFLHNLKETRGLEQKS